MYATNFFEKSFLNVMKGITFNAPMEVYVGLYLTSPTEEGLGTEIQYTGYERQKILFNNASLENGTIQIKNVNKIDYPETPVNAGKATYLGLSDSKIGGNMLAYSKLPEDMEVNAGESPVLLIGEVILFSTGNLSQSYKKKLLNVFNGQSIAGVTPHMALFNGDPDDGGAEMIGSNYERVSVEFTVPEESPSKQMVIMNNGDVEFNRPLTDWGLWNYNALMDTKVQGEPIWIYNRGLTKEIKKGYMPNAKKGNLKFSIN